ncbi:FO synthase [Caulobacter ginsengisoli]|uniref:FO synthase n=1 Tax=Caulobacter ginsengisoli TaxID=400775 RepID=A0ABU0IY33_9CAUL|nr:5-amino-6-(D-ribitylamino)uracil--L-tyrosine 4-hydroxyphenyl transferase CofH [Caulobacter ginsengisoli]MDQ0466917.1 FO synthase [Caulobacter ginsengisoli]
MIPTLTPAQAHLRQYLLDAPLDQLTARARAVRDEAFGGLTTYSRKVFIPLTQLCRDVCHYCTFAKAPRGVAKPYLTPDEVLGIARRGAAAGCKEALFTLGDKPELRYPAARAALADLGFDTTLAYLEHVAGRVLRETGLLPHINAGILTAEDYRRLRPVSASMGLMLESASERLCARGGPHHGSPDKVPAVRLTSIAAAGEAGVPFTSGLLIGIGETRTERLDGLFALQALHARHGHLQEVIIQNFRAKPGTRMADAPEPGEEELVWTIAAARLILDPSVGVQAPPNLNPGRTAALIEAGLNDWGGISPVTLDHVNPEAPWPEIETLRAECVAEGHDLAERLAIWPLQLSQPDRWLDRAVRGPAMALSDSLSLARDEAWSPGLPLAAPGLIAQPLGPQPLSPRRSSPALDRCLARVLAGAEPDPADLTALFAARGEAAREVVAAADDLRRSVKGETVTYVVNRNINYTNICSFSCSFCAFSKTSSKGGHRDRPYNLPLEEIAGRVREAWDRGATEVCLQGGIHPSYTGRTYLDICRAVKRAVPGMHVHAFSPLEIAHGARTLDLTWSELLEMLQDEGLGSLPGTAAEILDDEVRSVICPDKLNTADWLGVIEAAHRLGLRTTATIMFGHMDAPRHWATHLLAIRRLQARTGGFTEFVPLPFVHMQSPIYVRGGARRGPTWRETVLMHAIARIALHGQIDNIQASWVKLGLDGATALLGAGVNDLGGVLMNESISRAAGSAHGQELQAATLEAAVLATGRQPRRRTTLYGAPGRLLQAV